MSIDSGVGRYVGGGQCIQLWIMQQEGQCIEENVSEEATKLVDIGTETI